MSSKQHDSDADSRRKDAEDVCEATNATSYAKMTDSGGRIPGEIALNARA